MHAFCGSDIHLLLQTGPYPVAHVWCLGRYTTPVLTLLQLHCTLPHSKASDSHDNERHASKQAHAALVGH